ncbi:hypothetical protein PAMP_009289 [Pampus punctatissimus]
MSSVWLRHRANFCLFFIALSGAVRSSGVEWKKVGEQVTIQCKCQSDQEYLFLKKGLEEDQVLFTTNKKHTISPQFADRLQLNGQILNLDILITNLTLNDTGLYWCEYKRFDMLTKTTKSTKDTGSVLLVVTDETHQYTKQQCDLTNNTLVLAFTAVCSTALLMIIFALFIYIIYKIKTLPKSKKRQHVPTNDVYEDMRGTFRQ